MANRKVYGDTAEIIKVGDFVKLLDIVENRSNSNLSQYIDKKFIVISINNGCIGVDGFDGEWFKRRFTLCKTFNIFEGIDFSV